MSWYYVPGLATTGQPNETSPNEPWLTLSGKPTQRPLSWTGWKRRPWITNLNGLQTCVPSGCVTATEGSNLGCDSPGCHAGGVGDLASLGFDAEWGMLAASDVGAPHKRNRFWLLASHVGHTDGERRPEVTGSAPSVQEANWDDRDHVADGAGQGVADAASTGLQRPDRRQPPHPEPAGPSRPWPPNRDDADGWADWIAEGGPEPSLRRGSDGCPAELADALHAGGNGLVPAVAAAAFIELAERLGLARP